MENEFKNTEFSDVNVDEQTITIDYDVVWKEGEELNFKRFSYECDENEQNDFYKGGKIKSYLPKNIYDFYSDLINKNLPVIVFAGTRDNGSGVLQYFKANPI